jgi:hypothetical protein
MVTDFDGRSGRRLGRFEAVFDDERVVANAGVLLPATLAGRLGVDSLSLFDRGSLELGSSYRSFPVTSRRA